MIRISLVALSFIVLSSPQSFAWGPRGHEVVTSVAARLLEESSPQYSFLKTHEFDLGYYANVPDVIWRSLPPPASRQEPSQHYIDWTKDLESVFGSPKDLPLDFHDFKKKMGDRFELRNGVSPYRIHGILGRCKSLASHLSRDKQGLLLECLGLLSHYTGDLSMPLHVSENHDGQLTGQVGVHAFFETVLVNQLDPQIKVDVLKMAREQFSKSELTGQASEVAVRSMIADSFAHIPELLKTDKGVDRHDLPSAAEKFKSLIEARLVQGAILTAVVWRDILKSMSRFDDKKFTYFNGHPDYLEPGKESSQ